MAYVETSFKSKAALKRAVAAGRKLSVFQPAGIGSVPTNGRVTIEGPNYAMHTWYGGATMKNGIIVKVS